MKKLILAVAAVVAVSVIGVFAADVSNHVVSGTARPMYSVSGTQTAVSANSAAVGTLPANTRRVAGFVQNMGTAGLMVSLTATTTTTIYAAPVVLFPMGDTYGRDRLQLNKENVVYTGPVYFMGIDSTTYTTNAAGKASIVEFQN